VLESLPTPLIGGGGFEETGLVAFIDMTTETGYGKGTSNSGVLRPYWLVDTELK
jgi:hypothetical protein